MRLKLRRLVKDLSREVVDMTYNSQDGYAIRIVASMKKGYPIIHFTVNDMPLEKFEGMALEDYEALTELLVKILKTNTRES